MYNINATTIAVIIGVIVLVLGLGYFLIGTDSVDDEDNVVTLNEDSFDYMSKEMLFDERDLATETIQITGTIDGQLAVANANDFIEISSNSVESYTWETDGEEYNNEKLVHFYQEAGTHTVSLTVVDSNGNEHSDEIEITTRGIGVEVDEDESEVQYSETNEQLLHHGEVHEGEFTYTFEVPNTRFDEDKLSYEWDLGPNYDDKTSEEVTVTYDLYDIRHISVYIEHEDFDYTIKRQTTIHSGHDYHFGFDEPKPEHDPEHEG